MSDLIDTTEMYLRTILELEEEGVVPLRARIAERLHQSGPTVSQTVARMERDGLLTVQGDRHIELSEVGRDRAIRVMRKHRLAERLLVDIIGLEWEQVHDEACRWEHVISDDVERRLLELLGDPITSPYGNPIPGLGDLGATRLADAGEPCQSLPALVAKGEVRLQIRSIGENLQAGHETMSELHRAGILPGVTLDAAKAKAGVRLTTDAGESYEVDTEAAEQLFAVVVARG
ncbi:dihydrofolate reductase [Enemella dayhoffiae]|uniref:Dihydrofolate reductase n=1 Tax=Enemella dayhoffiae TaxID=2016507 RepID=A0A255H9K0_9ACTN|nr:metal-dependent transcriptional regulator [Enemella dayhoffiae]OYO24510.1 dihydrofolate reductase [Enemella dayhoffiae]